MSNIKQDHSVKVSKMDYHELNAYLNLYDSEGKIQFGKDKEAAQQYFLQHVNPNTFWFHSLDERFTYLLENDYYERELVAKYDFEFIKKLTQAAYAHKYRFQSFLGAYKFYTSYAMKTFDGKQYLERFEDRLVMVALGLADGDEQAAEEYLDEMIQGRFQPATPTFLNFGKKSRGELVSCFLLSAYDSMESITGIVASALQLSKRGGGVGINISNLREFGAPIKNVANAASGVVPVMKILEDSFSYANQLGSRQGAGAVYLHANHPDIMKFLDTKRENADEKVRIKTLSLGVIIPDLAFELARKNEDMYLFSPYDVERVYGVPFSEIYVTEKYEEMVADSRITKTKVSARKLFATIAEIQFESGYPYIMFEDNVNKAHNVSGKVQFSNLCVTGDSELLTSNGYKRVIDLYETQDDISVVSDNRVVNDDFTDATVSIQESTKMFKTAENAEVFKVETKEGFEVKATAWHKFYVEEDGDIVTKELHELELGDRLLVQPEEGKFGVSHNADLAYIAGVLTADGSFAHTTNPITGVESVSAKVYLYGDKREVQAEVQAAIHRVLSGREDLISRQATLTPEFHESAQADRAELTCAPLAKLLAEYGLTYHNKDSVPEFVKRGDRETQLAYLSGMYQMDASITGSTKYNVLSIELGSTKKKHLQEIQVMLLNLGVYSRIYSNRKESGKATLPDGKGGTKEYNQAANWTLRVSNKHDRDVLYPMLTWLERHTEFWNKYHDECPATKKAYITHKYRATVSKVVFHSIQDVYDVTVDNGHSVVFNGLSTSNCSEILQVTTPTSYDTYDGSTKTEGRDISCNLGSLNIAKVMDGGDLGKTVGTAIRGLTSVSDQSDIAIVPSVRNGNEKSHAVGLGQMNLHGFLARERIHYGSEEALDFVSSYFAAVAFYSVQASNDISQERGETFYEFDKSKYASGEYFDKYTTQSWKPKTAKVQELFQKFGIELPTQNDWEALKQSVMKYGMYNAYLQAVAPTGSISYINYSTSSIHPITSKIEIRKEGKLGRTYTAAPYLTNDNGEFYEDAYELGYEKTIDTYAAAQEHVDQGLSLTLFFKDTDTTRDLNKSYISAWRKGIKTIYYIRVRQLALEGTEDPTCVSCAV